jgi:hypothetical protein
MHTIFFASLFSFPRLHQDDMTDLEIVGRDLFADDISAPGHAIGYSHVFANTMDASFDSGDDQLHGGGADAYFTQHDDAGVFEDNDEGADFGGIGSAEAPSVQGPSLLVNRSRLVFEVRFGSQRWCPINQPSDDHKYFQ